MADRIAGFVVVSLMAIGTFADKPPNPRTMSGKKFVEALQWKDAKISAAEKGRIALEVDGTDEPVVIPQVNLQVIEEAILDDKPVVFAKKPVFLPGEAVRIAKPFRTFYVLFPKPPEKEQEKKPAPKRELRDDEIDIVPKLEEVSRVLILDTKAKREEYDLLPEGQKVLMLRFAGAILGMKHVESPVGGNVFATISLSSERLRRNSRFFDQKKVEEFILKTADENGYPVFELMMKPEESKVRAVKLEYGWLGKSLNGLAHVCARQIKEQGLGALADHEKDFVRSHKVLFGLE